MFSIFASILVALAFKPIVKNKYLLLSFYFYFCFLRLVLHEYSTRTYRNALVIPAVEIIIACLLAIYYRKYSSSKKCCRGFRASCFFSFLLVHSRRFHLASSFYCSRVRHQFRPDLARTRLFFQRSKEVKRTTISPFETRMAETFIVLLL